MTRAPLRIGLIARADNTGLGNQTKGFYDHMRPAKTLVVDISRLNGYSQHPERYPDAVFVRGFPTAAEVDSFLTGLDAVFVAEAPYNFYLYTQAKELGVKVAVQYNYEFFEWFANPELPLPDMLIAPSRWHYEDVDQFCRERGVAHAYLHCPVDRDLLPYREIKRATTFLHTAGRAAAYDRNGTLTVIAASRLVKSDVKIKVHFQGQQGLPHQATHDFAFYQEYARQNGGPAKLELIQKEYENYPDVYADAGVLVLPRRYGGNCLPLNEALSCGMPVIMPAISPNDALLPANWLLPATPQGRFTPRTEIDIYNVVPEVLAAKIDELAGLSSDAMHFENLVANDLANKISWKAMAPRYQEALEKLCSR